MRLSLFLAAAATMAITPSAAHEWYPSDCCSGTDCYEIQASELTPLPNGWRVNRTGEVFSYTQLRANGKPKVRMTPPEAGGTYHRCSFRNGDPNANTICIFVPPIGF